MTSKQQAEFNDYNETIRVLLSWTPTIVHGELDPTPIALRPDAANLFVEILQANEAALADEFAQLQDFISKVPEHAVRLAAVMAAYGNANNPIIDERTMDAGHRVAIYYAKEMDRLRHAAMISEEDALAEQLRGWCIGRRVFHLAEVYQSGPSRKLRNADLARRTVDLLVERGWLEPLPPDTVFDGSPRRDAWKLRE